MRVLIVCPCGKEFSKGKSAAKRARYCSKKCFYKYRKRPSGLEYNILVENKGWFKPGVVSYCPPKGSHSSPGTEFKKGQRASPLTEFKKGVRSYNFKGDAVGYHALHSWIARHFIKPRYCEQCGKKLKLQWASKTWKYTRDREDWWALCFKCHRKYDSENAWGIASQMFPEIRK